MLQRTKFAEILQQPRLRAHLQATSDAGGYPRRPQ
jgi:hypothetical protein